MKTPPAKASANTAQPVGRAPESVIWFGWAALAALALGIFVYGPALQGPFVFDDYVLPFRLPGFDADSLSHWLSGVRPLLMLSYWGNYQLSGRESTLSYHLSNVLIHCLNSLLAGAIVWRILAWRGAEPGRRAVLTAVAGGVFLLHPLQSESVAYIAGRSESLSALWCLCAWAISVYRPTPVISWGRALSILAFFGAAVLTKEHTVALAGVLLLTDWFASDAPLLAVIRRNWRLYAPIAIGAVAGVAAAWRVLATSTSAGFQMQGMQWYEYALTQSRVLLAYVRLSLLPVGLTVDHDVALSSWPPDVWTVLAVLFWVAAAVVAVIFRRKYPVACFGLAIFLVFLAPTSSFIPIKDVMAERRMYLPLIGLLLIAIDGLSRLRTTNFAVAAVSGCVLTVLAVGVWNRSKAWGDDVKLWESAIAATPTKGRPYGNLASVFLIRRQCGQAVNTFDRAERAGANMRDGNVLATWGLALECNGNVKSAISKLEQSVEVEPSAQAYSSLGRMYIRTDRLGDAEKALAEAERLNPAWDMTYVYSAMLKSVRNDEPGAVAELKRALDLNPANRHARKMLEEVAQRSRYSP